jgi:hypothetical protein
MKFGEKMGKYRKKQVVIEAFCFGVYPIPDWFTDKVSAGEITLHNMGKHQNPWLQGYCLIPTLEGTMRCEIGDWIIKGVAGEFYPCKPDIFAATYEEVKEEG